MTISQYLLKSTTSNIKELAVKLAIQINENKKVNDIVLVNDSNYTILTSDILNQTLETDQISNPKTLKDFNIDELKLLLDSADLEIVKYNIRKEIESRG